MDIQKITHINIADNIKGACSKSLEDSTIADHIRMDIYSRSHKDGYIADHIRMVK